MPRYNRVRAGKKIKKVTGGKAISLGTVPHPVAHFRAAKSYRTRQTRPSRLCLSDAIAANLAFLCEKLLSMLAT